MGFARWSCWSSDGGGSGSDDEEDESSPDASSPPEAVVCYRRLPNMMALHEAEKGGYLFDRLVVRAYRITAAAAYGGPRAQGPALALS